MFKQEMDLIIAFVMNIGTNTHWTSSTTNHTISSSVNLHIGATGRNRANETSALINWDFKSPGEEKTGVQLLHNDQMDPNRARAPTDTGSALRSGAAGEL